jgi:hypothetical protein
MANYIQYTGGITFNLPTPNGETINVSSFYINVSTNLSTFSNMTLYVDGDTYFTTQPSLLIQYNTTEDGIYYFNATALTIFDEAFSTETRNITIDLSIPTVSFVSPTPASNTYTSLQYFYINVSANMTGFSNMTLFVNNDSFFTNQTPLFIQYNGTDGVYYFNATAYKNDDSNYSSITRNITIDTISPIIQFVPPTQTNGATLVVPDLNINISSTDTNLKNITSYLYDDGLNLLATYTTATSPNYHTFSGLPDGVYYYVGVAYDKAGNYNITETRNITIVSPSFTNINIEAYSSGISNLVKLDIYVASTDVIHYCYIKTVNSVDEDEYYWSNYPNTNVVNKTIVFEKTDNSRILLTCYSDLGATASTDYIAIKAQQGIPDWLVWACLLGSVLLLLYAIKSENLFFGIFASLGFLVFVKLSEGAFITEIESLVPVFFWIKVVFAISLVLLIAQQFLKQAKSEIS